MIDTHCHLNFHSFDGQVDEVIRRGIEAGITRYIVPGTDVASSEKACHIASNHDNVWAAVGIHPHHVYDMQSSGQIDEDRLNHDLTLIEKMLEHPRVVAIGEVGLDRHYYDRTKYTDYQVTSEFIELQKYVFKRQIEMAISHGKALVIHHREAVADLMSQLPQVWDTSLSGRSVVHCCEPNMDILEFAKSHNVYIGVDGDVTYDRKKQAFVRDLPLEMLVVETDSPFLIPEPHRSKPRDTRGPNEPMYIPLIVNKIAQLKDISPEEVIGHTVRNAESLFGLTRISG